VIHEGTTGMIVLNRISATERLKQLRGDSLPGSRVFRLDYALVILISR
jgi:hypothetical protein